MQSEESENSLENCDYCHDPTTDFFRFSCSHKICNICLYRRIFCNNLKDLQNNNEIITIKCKCENGLLKRSFDELEIILQKKSQIDKEKEKEKEKEKAKSVNRDFRKKDKSRDKSKKLKSFKNEFRKNSKTKWS